MHKKHNSRDGRMVGRKGWKGWMIMENNDKSVKILIYCSIILTKHKKSRIGNVQNINAMIC
jgi:hypothetical protein